MVKLTDEQRALVDTYIRKYYQEMHSAKIVELLPFDVSAIYVRKRAHRIGVKKQELSTSDPEKQYVIDSLIEEYYPEHGTTKIQKLLEELGIKRSQRTIRNRANKLGLTVRKVEKEKKPAKPSFSSVETLALCKPWK